MSIPVGKLKLDPEFKKRLLLELNACFIPDWKIRVFIQFRMMMKML